jgi:hypothetical protein
LLPSEEKTKDKWLEILDDIRVYNQMIKDKKLPLPMITARAIKTNLKRAMKPSKRERLRKQ